MTAQNRGQTPTIVAIDGPAGSGKSSVSRATARKLGFGYLDTGAAYRALAWHVTDSGLDRENADAVRGSLTHFDYSIGLNPDHVTVTVNGTDVTAAIRTPETSAAVSAVARVPEVREYLTNLFRSIVASSELPGVIVEGRDITTVVFADAPVRILLTADESVRAARRGAELIGAVSAAAESVTDSVVDQTADQIRARDAADSKVVDFMNAAEGVEVVDSTALNFDETVDAVITVIRAATVKEQA
ncbi:(d)CMP kinase [Lysinibacter cavernae]|uniref:Cytidylate kinase n=1 Tax=Lysinibacter cavernae TaxID=1640652 RepID=A0A7X5R0G7_9MICO|nr:(d)CMP kinase [Lysinibacter cavernae]NIH53344.1 cytidylate kinase [Lysinibacter cavernae]